MTCMTQISGTPAGGLKDNGIANILEMGLYDNRLDDGCVEPVKPNLIGLGPNRRESTTPLLAKLRSVVNGVLS